MKFEVYADKAGKYRWRLISGNGQNVASGGESFSSKASATAAVSNFKTKAASWNYDVYADKAGKYRWRALSSNGQNVGSGGESFSSKASAQNAADNIKANASGASGP